MPFSGVVAFPPSMPSKPERSVRLVHPVPRPLRRGYFPLPRTAADICVRTVRNGPAIRFQVIAADGPGHLGPSTVRRRQLAKPFEHKGLCLARTVRTMRTVAPRHLLAHW
jgi:hypothetical protein